jgi:hypothetical protein
MRVCDFTLRSQKVHGLGDVCEFHPLNRPVVEQPERRPSSHEARLSVMFASGVSMFGRNVALNYHLSSAAVDQERRFSLNDALRVVQRLAHRSECTPPIFPLGRQRVAQIPLTLENQFWHTSTKAVSVNIRNQASS